MAIFTAPRSLNNALAQDPLGPSLFMGANVQSSHPSFFHLVLLVFEAVLEVVCVSLPGYIVARQGLFDAEAQKFVANLNVMLFTPCLSMPNAHPYHPLIAIVAITPHSWIATIEKLKLTQALPSLHQTRLSIDRRKTYRSRHYPCYLHRSDRRLILVRIHSHAMLWFQETSVQFCDRDGGMLPPSPIWIASLLIPEM